MKAIKLLHKNLTTACPFIREVRLTTLMAGITSALTKQQVTVTGLGRNLKAHSKTKTKHDIKRMDRLIDARHLHDERKELYRYQIKMLVGNRRNPIFLADCSPIPGNEIFQLLRLSIPMGGRSLTIHEECHKEEKLNNTAVYNNFLSVSFYIFDYPAQAELQVREHIDFACEKLTKRGIKFIQVNIFEIILE